MSDEFTPGPWLLNERGDVKSASNEILAIILTLDQREANARLIATAPELLEALEWYTMMAKRMGDAVIMLDNQAALTLMKDIAVDYGGRGKHAIAKARGHE